MSIVNSVIFDTDAAGSASTTFTVGSGTDRVLGLVICHEQNTSGKLISAVTVGGVSATRKGYNIGGSGTTIPYVEFWYILESSIGSVGSNPTISVTPGASGHYYVSGTMFTLDGCDQTAANWTEASDADTSVTALSTTLTTVNGGNVVGGITYTVTGFSIATDANLTEVTSSDRNMASGGAFRSVQFYTVATGSSTSIGGDANDSNAARYQNVYAVGFPLASTTPTISGTSDDTPTDGSSLTINGSGFGASQGSGGVTAGGVGWTETSWGNTSIAVTVALGNNRYNANVSLVVTDDSANASDGYNVQIQPASGKSYINLSGTPAATGTERITAIPDLDGTEQLEVSNVVGGSISDVTLYSNATWSAAEGVTSFDVRAHNGTEWGSVATQDLTPDTTAPTLTSATIGTNGTSLTLVFAEAVTIGAGGNGGLSFTAAGGSATCTYSSGTGTDTLVYTLSRTIADTEVWAELDYTQPTNGIEDTSGNDVASFFDVPATNNSTQNAAPTDISLSISTIAEDAGLNTTVGQLSATDADYGDTHTFTLVAGTGDTNNASFTISGTSLICPDPATLGDGTYSVRVRATDSAANTFDKAFTITVTAAAVVLERINYIDRVTGTDGTADMLCEVGDLLVAWVSRDGSVTTPTLPSGWTSIVAGGASSLGYRLAYKVATSELESSGTWTNATSIAISQYRPGTGYTLSTGAWATGVNSSGTNALYPALTLEDTSGYSWVQCNYAHRSADIAASDATAAGLTVRAFVQDATDTLAVHTASKVSTFAATTVTYTGTSGSRRYVAVEIKATAPSTGNRGLVRALVKDLVRGLSTDLVG
jgi:hypothetical protein